MSRETCHACGASPLTGLDSAGFAAVSSDIRIVAGVIEAALCPACGLLQKRVDQAWRASVAAVYEAYRINYQSGGADPHIFNSRYGAGPRASILVRHMQAELALPDVGNMLDIGCASGNVLRAFGAAYPGWRQHGVERAGQWRDSVMQIAGVVGFEAELEAYADVRFDLIVMSHVLEHILDPIAYLRGLCGYLNPGGILFLAVPDIRQNPIDLFVLDHCSHFDEPTLAGVLAAGGFNALSLRSDVLGKEIVAACRPGVAAAAPLAYHQPLIRVAQHYVELCRRLLQHARAVRAAQARMYVMGTATAAAWLAAGLDMQVDGFVDEDRERIGRQAFDKPILALAEVPAGSCVYIPMASDKAREIIARSARTDLQFAYLADNDVSMALVRA